MLAGALYARRKPQHLLGLIPEADANRDDLRTAFGQGARLVHDKVSIRSMRSNASAFLISTPTCAPRPTPTMIDIGVASPSAQAGDNQHADRGNQAEGEARLGAVQRPRPKATSAMTMTAGTNQPAT